MKKGSPLAALAGTAAVCAANASVQFAPAASSLSSTSYIASARNVFEEDHEYVSSLTPTGASLATSLESLGITARASLDATHTWYEGGQQLDVAVAMTASLARTGPDMPYWEAQGNAVYMAAIFVTLTEPTTLRFDATVDGVRFDDRFEIGLYDYAADEYAVRVGLGAGEAWSTTATFAAGEYFLDLYGLLYEVAFRSTALGGARSAALSLTVAAVPAPPGVALGIAVIGVAGVRRRRGA